MENIIKTDRDASLFIDLADKDYLAVRLLFGCGNCFYNLAAYHSQQCLEKYLKAFLVQKTSTYLKTHNLKELREMAEAHNSYFSKDEVKKALAEFDKYDQVTRYSAEATYDPNSQKNKCFEIKGVWSFGLGFGNIRTLDKLVYEIRSLMDFDKLKGRNNLKDIFKEEKNNSFIMCWKLPIPIKRVLTIENDYWGGRLDIKVEFVEVS
ncbi:MAG: HEPN domain-containing protein [Candidatus Omnitrophica bacterium]|nr:HEPN domain-containing protein [Candidatus Omnitrophota bacterium]